MTVGVRDIVYAVLFLSFTLAILWPLPIAMIQSVPGGSEDIWQGLWNFWWVWSSLAGHDNGHDLFFSSYLFYPQGSTLSFHVFGFLASIPGALLVSLFRMMGLSLVECLALSYNLVTVASFWLAGWCMFRLLRTVGVSPLSAIFGAIAYEMSPYAFSHLAVGHLYYAQIFVLPLLVERSVVFFRRPCLRTSIGLTAVLVIAYLVESNPFLFCLLLFCIFVVDHSASLRSVSGIARHAALSMFILGLCVVIILPLLIPRVKLIVSGSADFAESKRLYQARPMDYLRPSFLHPLNGSYHHPQYPTLFGTHISKGYEENIPLGFSLLLLAVCGVRSSFPLKRPLLIAALLFFILSFGPSISLPGGVNVPNVFYLVLITHNPLMAAFRTPVRFALVVFCVVTIFAAMGLDRIRDFFIARKREKLAGIVVCVAIFTVFFEFLAIPLPLSAVGPVPTFFSRFAGSTEVLYFPEIEPTTFPRWMFYQTVHERPMVNGYLSRSPQSAQAIARSLDELLQKAMASGQKGDSQHFIRSVRQYGVTMLVLTDNETERAVPYLSGLFGPPLAIDQSTRPWSYAFSVRPHREAMSSVEHRSTMTEKENKP